MSNSVKDYYSVVTLKLVRITFCRTNNVFSKFTRCLQAINDSACSSISLLVFSISNWTPSFLTFVICKCSTTLLKNSQCFRLYFDSANVNISSSSLANYSLALFLFDNTVLQLLFLSALFSRFTAVSFLFCRRCSSISLFFIGSLGNSSASSSWRRCSSRC